MKPDDERLLLSDLLSLSWFRLCPGIHLKLVGGGPSRQSAGYLIVGKGSASAWKDNVVVSIKLGSLLMQKWRGG